MFFYNSLLTGYRLLAGDQARFELSCYTSALF